MNRQEIIEQIRRVEPALRAHGVGSLYLFGSRARQDDTLASDIDVFVDPASGDFYSLEHYMGAYEILTEALDRNVDFGTRAGLSKRLLADIEHDAIRVF